MNASRTPLWKAALPLAALVLLHPFAACNNGNISIGNDHQPSTCNVDADCPPNEGCVQGTCASLDGGSGACCPASYELYTCTYPDGGAGAACHNPALGCASSFTCGQGCDPVVEGPCSDGGTTVLKWYATCGDPVCTTHQNHPGVPACTTEVAGAPCSAEGQQCDPGNACNSLLVCATTDPTKQPGGCPISRARFKHDIRYLPDAELARVRDELVTMRLATWRYNHEGAGAREHLGFIIDDKPDSPSVDASGDHVDLYGYTSMAVAAVQVQDRELAAQRRQIEALQRDFEGLREDVRACRVTGGGQQR